MIPVFIICIIILVFVLINTVLVVTLHLLNKKIASAPLPDKTKKCSTEKGKIGSFLTVKKTTRKNKNISLIAASVLRTP